VVGQYAAGVACLAASEVAYGAWMAASLAAWWRSAPEAELARRGMDLMHDLKPMLLAVERYRDVAVPLYDMILVRISHCAVYRGRFTRSIFQHIFRTYSKASAFRPKLWNML
jgi:hypothetical protein